MKRKIKKTDRVKEFLDSFPDLKEGQKKLFHLRGSTVQPVIKQLERRGYRVDSFAGSYLATKL